MRYQLFSAPHKALRYLLNQLSDEAGKLEPNQLNMFNSLAMNFNDLYMLVYAHANHEDNILFTELDKIVSGRTSRDRDEHERLHRLLDQSKEIIDTLTLKANGGGVTHEEIEYVYSTICKLHAEMLVHMIDEETITQPVFWQHMTDEQLGGFRVKVMEVMTPEESALWLKYIIASHSFSFVVGLLKEAKKDLPEQVYQRVVSIAKAHFPDKSFSLMVA